MFFKLQLAVTSLLILSTYQQFILSGGCTTNENQFGSCRPKSECPPVNNKPRKMCENSRGRMVCCPHKEEPVSRTRVSPETKPVVKQSPSIIKPVSSTRVPPETKPVIKQSPSIISLVFNSINPQAVTIVEAPILNFECGIKENRFRRSASLLHRSYPGEERRLLPWMQPQKRRKRSSSPDFVPFIIGGRAATQGAWPWMALMGKLKNGRLVYFCDGALINEKYVLSAAHCLLEPGLLFFVVLAEHDHSIRDEANSFIAQVNKFTRHPQYKLGEGYHDLALIELKREVGIKFDVRPICLPWGTPSNADLVDNVVTVTGWGRTRFGGRPSSDLQEVNVTVFNSITCHNSYSTLGDFKTTFPEGMNSENMLCAGDLEGGKDSCNGDSGGPLVHVVDGKWTLVGIVSKGFGCGLKDFPGLYAPIRNLNHLQWIKEVAFA